MFCLVYFVFSCQPPCMEKTLQKLYNWTEVIKIQWLQGVWGIISGFGLKRDVVKVLSVTRWTGKVIGGGVVATGSDGKSTCWNHLRKSLSLSRSNVEACLKCACYRMYAHKWVHVGKSQDRTCLPSKGSDFPSKARNQPQHVFKILKQNANISYCT